MRRAAALVLVLLPAWARAQEEPQAPPAPARERSMDIERPDSGFGQDEGEAPRLPRVRVELSALGGIMDILFRQGTAGLSNRFDVEGELGIPRFTPGFRVSGTVKLHRYFALGGEYFRLALMGGRANLRHDIRMGPFPSEFPPFSRVVGAVELQQASFTLRFVAADDNEIRAEFSGGVTWVSCRVGIHPQAPPPMAQDAQGHLIGGGFFTGASESNEAWLAPALGTFFAWNFDPHCALFVDSTTSYFSFWRTFGSIASINRVGLRWKVWDGLEIVTGIFLVSGQVYDLRDRLKFIGIGSSHVFHQATWLGGGPELGISFTY